MKARKFFVTMQAEVMVSAMTQHEASIMAMKAWSDGEVPTVVTMRWSRNLDQVSSCHFRSHPKKGTRK